jgi:hypothetical protein
MGAMKDEATATGGAISEERQINTVDRVEVERVDLNALFIRLIERSVLR